MVSNPGSRVLGKPIFQGKPRGINQYTHPSYPLPTCREGKTEGRGGYIENPSQKYEKIGLSGRLRMAGMRTQKYMETLIFFTF
jgi:hypothetical protein